MLLNGRDAVGVPHKYGLWRIESGFCSISVSEAPAEMPKQQKYQSFEVYQATYKTDEQKKEEV